jgi:tetratricopeptide (TPR) repeat protein
MKLLTQVTHRLMLGFLLVAVLGAGGWLVASSRPRPRNDLSELERLLERQEFDTVEQKLLDYLASEPDSPQANMLMAQVALARKDQQPELALRHLRRIKTANRATLAMVRLNEGKAYSALGRYDLAERSWLEGLRIDPLVPEAGWALLGLFYVQGRREDAHQLAMQLHGTEPDPRDRVQLLLELLRQDVKSVAAETVVPVFEPIVREHPEDRATSIALGLSLIRTSRPDEGLNILRRVQEASPDDPRAWECLLMGLDESFRYDEIEQVLQRLPEGMARDHRFDRARGALAQSRRAWTTAADSYRRAWERDPSDGQVLYRLCQVLRAGREGRDLEKFERDRRALEEAREQSRSLYEEANELMRAGSKPSPELMRRLAEVREKSGRPDEAAAWHRLVLAEQPEDPVSRSAMLRLSAGRGE